MANHGSWASWRSAAGQRGASRRRGRRVARQRTRPPDIAKRRPNTQLAQDRRGDADGRESVVDQQRAAVGDAPPPVADVGACRARTGGRRRCTARRSGRATIGVGGGARTRATWRTRSRTPAAARLASNDRAVIRRLRRRSPRSPAARGRFRRAGRWRRSRRRRARPAASTIVERPRKLPISTIRPPGGHVAAAAYRTRPCSGVIQPSTAATLASVSSNPTHHRYTPSANTTTQTAPAAAGRDRGRRPPLAPRRGPARAPARSAAGQ